MDVTAATCPYLLFFFSYSLFLKPVAGDWALLAYIDGVSEAVAGVLLNLVPRSMCLAELLTPGEFIVVRLPRILS